MGAIFRFEITKIFFRNPEHFGDPVLGLLGSCVVPYLVGFYINSVYIKNIFDLMKSFRRLCQKYLTYMQSIVLHVNKHVHTLEDSSLRFMI